jgi:cation:H+ antiporter
VLCAVYGALTVVGLIINRRHVAATLRAPFGGSDDDGDAVRFDGRELSIVSR